ncbi:MAG: pantetheine-phosphate adenylyltransferase [Deltaproteobacteria bacterium]
MKVCVYPGSFDPITYGHLDIIERASKIFDKLIVAVSCNPNKIPAFSLEERVELIQDCIKDYGNVEVDYFCGLLIDYLKQKGATVVVKGLRVITDFEYEFQMALLNKNLDPDIETVFMMTNNKFSYISSSMVKEIARLGANIEEFVPTVIKQKVLDKLTAGKG